MNIDYVRSALSSLLVHMSFQHVGMQPSYRHLIECVFWGSEHVQTNAGEGSKPGKFTVTFNQNRFALSMSFYSFSHTIS